MTSEESKAKEILFKLLKASNEEEVRKIIETDGFFKEENWKPYGGYDGNFNTINNQAKNSIAALIEKPINSIDAILLKKCKLKGIDPTTQEAPNSMQEGVEQFFGIKKGDFSEATSKNRRELASNIRIIAEGSKEKPNIIVVDFGEGQHPNDFENTFLSLHRGNKANIRFVQGKYNMGGSGVLPNCGKYHYQLILSRKIPQLLIGGQEDRWGFTLVRLHIVKGTEYKNSWYEFCVNENGKIPSFPYEPLQILPVSENLESGTYIKLYNYSLEDPSVITLGLWRAMNRFLHAPALPILLYEAREYKGHSPSKILLGNKARILVDDKSNIENHFVINIDLGAFGQRNVEITLFREGTSKTEYTTQNDAIFFTINGQTHATIGRSFLKTRAKLPYLADYLLIHIDCTEVDTNIRENTFMPSRDRMRDNEYSREIEEILATELARHEGLKKLNELRRERLVSKNPKDTAFMEKLVSNLIKSNRSLLAYLNLGGKVKDIKQIGTEEIEKFEGSYFPTYLKIKNWDANKGTYRKEIPVNSFVSIKLETDAPNDYFDRNIDSGNLLVSSIIKVKSYSLFNGNISLKVAPKENAKVGEMDTVEVELTRVNDVPLSVNFEVKYMPPIEPQKTTPPDEEPKPKGKDYKLPEPQLVYKEKKEDYPCWEDFNWTGADIAKVEVSTEGGNGERKGEKLDVYINMDADDLHNFLRRKQVSQKQQEIYIRSYETAIFLNSLVIYNELHEVENKDEILSHVMKGISKITLDLMHNEELLKELESG